MNNTIYNIDNMIHNSHIEHMDSLEKKIFFLKRQISTLHSKNELMCASENDFLKEKIKLKEHNTIQAIMITNLNGYINQLRSSISTIHHANTLSIITTSHRGQKIPDPPLFAWNRSKAQAWIVDMRLKLTANTQFFRTEQVKMIYINSHLKGPVKDQIYSFIYDNLSFKFADANIMFSFLTSLYNDSNQRKSVVSALGNLHQRNKPFTDFMPKFTHLMNDVRYTNDQVKIDLRLLKFSNKKNQLLIGQDMPMNYLGYVTRLHKLDTNVRVAGQ